MLQLIGLPALALKGNLVAELIDLQGRIINVGASMRIALFPECGTDSLVLMQPADIAMNFAKAACEGGMPVCRRGHGHKDWLPAINGGYRRTSMPFDIGKYFLGIESRC